MMRDAELQVLAKQLAPWIFRVFYEPLGTWTPTYQGSGVAGTTTYTLQQGNYMRFGNFVVATATIVWSAATGTGNARFSLPFAASSTTNQNYSGGVRTVNVTFANGAPQVQLTAGLSYITLESPLTNAANTTVQMEAAGNVIYTVAYFIDG